MASRDVVSTYLDLGEISQSMMHLTFVRCTEVRAGQSAMLGA